MTGLNQRYERALSGYVVACCRALYTVARRVAVLGVYAHDMSALAAQLRRTASDLHTLANCADDLAVSAQRAAEECRTV